MDWLQIDQATFWFALGFILLAVELVVFGLSSGVLLFGSLGAITTGILLWTGIVPNTFIIAVACFALSTALVTAVLWAPLKKMQSGAELGKDRSSDLIGHTFILAEDITTDKFAQQKFSGISWSVRPSDDWQKGAISRGTQVTVTAVSAGIFYVQPVQKA